MERKLSARTFMGKRRLLISTATISIISILLLAGLGLTMFAHAQSDNEDGRIRVTGTFTTQRGPLTTHVVSGLTIFDYNVVATFAGTDVGTSNQLNTLAVDATGSGRATGYGTFWGTVGDSAPGVNSFINTFVFKLTSSTTASFSGNSVTVQGSGIGGLAGMCGSITFTGTLDLTTGAGSGTYDGIAQFGGSCNPAD